MALVEYPDNSIANKAREVGNNTETKVIETKKYDTVVSGVVKQKRKSVFSNLFSREDISNVGDYILNDVIIPTVRTTFVSVISDAARMIFLGEPGNANDRATTGGRVSYQNYYDRRDKFYGTPYDRSSARKSYRGNYDYDDIELPNRGAGDRVLDIMREQIEELGYVTVGEYYELVGLTGDHTTYKYGWTNLEDAWVRRRGNGYFIEFPRVKMLNVR